MQEKAKQAGVNFRPHFKTHQSLTVGQWVRELGVKSIAASSLMMAEYFASDGWRDITVAFPTNVREMDRINRLAKDIDLQLIVESAETIQALSRGVKHPLGIMITVDLGYHRTGIDARNAGEIQALIQLIEQAENLTFRGFLGHAGHSYKSIGQDDIAAVHAESMAAAAALEDNFRADHPDMVISVGDTPTTSKMDAFGPVNEIRPGNFVFFDLTQWKIGACSFEQIAVALACPVVAKHYDRNEVVVYGGGIHLAKDRSSLPDGTIYYGLPVPWEGKGPWGQPDPRVYVKSVSQEHGLISANKAYLDSLSIGDLVLVLPIHSCMTADTMGGYITLEGEAVDHFMERKISQGSRNG